MAGPIKSTTTLMGLLQSGGEKPTAVVSFLAREGKSGRKSCPTQPQALKYLTNSESLGQLASRVLKIFLICPGLGVMKVLRKFAPLCEKERVRKGSKRVVKSTKKRLYFLLATRQAKTNTRAHSQRIKLLATSSNRRGDWAFPPQESTA